MDRLGPSERVDMSTAGPRLPLGAGRRGQTPAEDVPTQQHQGAGTPLPAGSTEPGQPDVAAGCPDCGVTIGAAHEDACDVARCLWTGRQRLACPGGHACGQDIWTGEWPGDQAARAFGWFVRWDGRPSEGGRGWVRTTAEDPDAEPDLNRLVTDARWDRSARRWVQRG
jgi:hypothetical protein